MPDRFTTICLVDGPPLLQNAFRDAGHRVLALEASPAPFFDLSPALAAADCVPDLVIQVEKLGARSILLGLERVDCPTQFWALDPHLNAYWQSAYARLFDQVLSTQKAWLDRIAAQGAQDTRWLPWYGTEREFKPWGGRQHGLAFVGRMTEQRPARKWMVDFIREKAASFSPAIRDAVSYAEMMDLYDTSKIIPNESIFGEVNFRLFEGASCGCLVLGQDIEEQAELFEPGREMEVYEHILEFDERLTACLKNDRLVQAMGRAAHARVQAEHLPGHRVARLVKYARDASRNRASGANATKWTALTACAMWEADLLSVDEQTLLDLLSHAKQDEDVIATTLRVQAMAGITDMLEDNVKRLLARPAGDALALNLTASMASLRLGNFSWAKAFRYRHLEAEGKTEIPPNDEKELLTQWARDLHRLGATMRAGLSFDLKRHLPVTAAECLLLILGDEPQDLPSLRLLDAMMRPIPGREQSRVGFLSILTLHERNDWRLALEIAMVNLKSYRLQSGVEELHLALELARAQGQEAAFVRVLKGRDSSGLMTAAVGL